MFQARKYIYFLIASLERTREDGRRSRGRCTKFSSVSHARQIAVRPRSNHARNHPGIPFPNTAVWVLAATPITAPMTPRRALIFTIASLEHPRARVSCHGRTPSTRQYASSILRVGKGRLGSISPLRDVWRRVVDWIERRRDGRGGRGENTKQWGGFSRGVKLAVHTNREAEVN